MQDDGTTTTILKYYSIAGMRVAMDDGTDLVYFASDHLSSTSISLDNSGTILSEQRYKPFGELRTDVGTILNPGDTGFTDFGYTGQRNLGDMGLMDYSARFYSPLLGRFIQPDTIIPNPGDSQAWNRYSYVKNNPIVFADPTGHIAEGACGFQGGDCPRPKRSLYPRCSSENPELCLAKIGGSGKRGGSPGDGGYCDLFPHSNGCTPDTDTITDTINPDFDSGHADGGTCYQNESTLVECFYNDDLIIFDDPDGDGTAYVDQDDFDLLLLAVYYELKRGSLSELERLAYDTPFWDYYGNIAGPQIVCFESGQCAKRTDVNYFAQGMYTAALGESRGYGELTVKIWKKQYGSDPTGALQWFNFGYDFYLDVNGGYDPFPSQPYCFQPYCP